MCFILHKSAGVYPARRSQVSISGMADALRFCFGADEDEDEWSKRLVILRLEASRESLERDSKYVLVVEDAKRWSPSLGSILALLCVRRLYSMRLI